MCYVSIFYINITHFYVFELIKMFYIWKVKESGKTQRRTRRKYQNNILYFNDSLLLKKNINRLSFQHHFKKSKKKNI